MPHSSFSLVFYFIYSVQFSHSVVSNPVTPWTVASQVPLSMEFSRQEYWSGLPCPPPGDLPSPGLKPGPPASPALAGECCTAEPPGKPPFSQACLYNVLPCRIFSRPYIVSLPFQCSSYKWVLDTAMQSSQPVPVLAAV